MALAAKSARRIWALLAPASIRWQYEHGVADTAQVSPDGSALDACYLQRPGAEAYQRDLPNADVRFLDTGHFALETHAGEVVRAIVEFMGR